ncbi:MAG: molybdenum cofactor guanylyltransferase [Desulfatiglandales bacterium]
MNATPKANINQTQRLDQITGVILAGGKSSRYGANKALVEISGMRLIDRVVQTVGSVFPHLLLVTNTPHEYAYLQIPMVEDLIKGLGPIGGIYTGLEVISGHAGFFVACDMPFVNPDLILHMIEVLEDFHAVVPRVDWKIEPLYAVYTKGCLSYIRKSIGTKEYQIQKLFDRIRVRYLEEEEIRAFDPELKTFLNINRPEELRHAEELA